MASRALNGFISCRGLHTSSLTRNVVRPYDIVVYGATGFTGQYAAAEAWRTRNDKKIAFAGRNKLKLEKTLDIIKNENHGEDDVGIIIADSSDNDSILEMCRQARVVVNCVGPYVYYGEQVVKACVETGTHHIDISGEPKFLQRCQLKYHDEAKAKGIHVVGTCGFDSVPADVGLEILRDHFPGELTFAESYIVPRGAGKANTGTYNSLIQAILDQSEVRKQNKLIFKKRLSYVGPQEKRKSIGWVDSVGKRGRYFIPFMGPDGGVVKRTQLYESTVYGKTPITYYPYFTLPTKIHVVCAMIFGLSLATLTKFDFGVKLLLRFPGFFSFGLFSAEGVKKEDLLRSSFQTVIHGKGYKVKPLTTNEVAVPDQKMTLTFKAPEMGYIFTSISMIAAAHTLLDDVLLNEGGVLTPGSAFKGTQFVERLKDRGVEITFS